MYMIAGKFRCQVLSALSAIALLLVIGVPGTYAASTGTSQVGITKVATLQVAGMDTDNLISDQAGKSEFSRTCLQTGGEPIPYRMAASSLRGHDGFQVSDSNKVNNIGYEVIWSDNEDEYRLSDSNDMTDVLQAEASTGCDNHLLSIEWDNDMFEAASGGAYTDTLSLMFVIE